MSPSSLTTDRIVLASRPQGAPTAANFRREQAALPELQPGQVLLRNRYLSLDPYMRGRMEEGPSYAAPVALDAVMEGRTVSEVLASRHDGLEQGALVVASGGWQTHAVVDGAGISRRLQAHGLPLSTALGVHGMPGFTAYAGLQEIGRVQPGETLVVAAASGPVGATVLQLAKQQGARVVGIAGGPDKRAYVETLGADVALDHRADGFAEQLRAAVPGGIDVYFENVGGKVFDAIVPLLNAKARVPLCGLIAGYNAHETSSGPDRLPQLQRTLLTKRARIQGFIVFDDYGDRQPEFVSAMAPWVRDGKVKFREDIVDGLEQAPEAFIGLLEGRNFGKLVVRVAQD